MKLKMENNIETFEDRLNSITGICSEKIRKHKALLEEYRLIKSSALLLPNLNDKYQRETTETFLFFEVGQKLLDLNILKVL